MDASLVPWTSVVRIAVTGGHAYHGPYEHITVEGMEKAVRHDNRIGENI